MKKLLIAALAVLFCIGDSWAGGGLSIGMTGAVKRKARDLDAMVEQSGVAVESISGHAAAGTALSSATVVVEDCSGRAKMAVTANDGSFTMVVTGLAFPLLLQVKSTPAYYGIAYAAGTSNLDPYTDLILRAYYRSYKGITSLDTAFANNFASLCGPPPAAAIVPLTGVVMNAVSSAMVRNDLSSGGYDPFTQEFSANGAGFDAVLDQTQIAANVDYSTVTITDLNSGVIVSTLNPVLNDYRAAAPAAPGHVGISSVSSNTISLIWSPSISTDTAGYGIYRNGALVTYVSSVSFTDTGLAPGTTYTYAVDAFNWAGSTSSLSATTTTVSGVPFNVSLLPAGNGSGTITSSPAGINCGSGGSSCSGVFPKNTTVTLTATPASGSTFLAWAGVFTSSGVSLSGNGTLTTTVGTGQSAVAWFTSTLSPQSVGKFPMAAGNFALSVGKMIVDPGADGVVTSSPTGISCQVGTMACSGNFPSGQQVTLTAQGKSNSTFSGFWGPGCSGTTSCTVTMSAAASYIAVFSGPGPSYTPGCPQNGTCSCTDGQPVCTDPDCPLVLIKDPVNGTQPYSYSSDFGPLGTFVNFNFDGNMTGTPNAADTPGPYDFSVCLIDMSLRSYCPPSSIVVQAPLIVTVTPNGGGHVTASPLGVGCFAGPAGTTCYDSPTNVTLTAVPSSAASTFSGWSGACSGTSTSCQVLMSRSESVTATFTVSTFTLTVATGGTGTGSVSSSDGDIACGATCSASYAYGTQVTLMAAATNGSTFAGWSGGGCSGAGSCVVTVNAATSVTATFSAAPINANGAVIDLLEDVYNLGSCPACTTSGETNPCFPSGTETYTQNCFDSGNGSGSISWNSCSDVGTYVSGATFTGSLQLAACSGSNFGSTDPNFSFDLTGNIAINGQNCSLNLVITGMVQTEAGDYTGAASGTACGQAFSIPGDVDWSSLTPLGRATGRNGFRSNFPTLRLLFDRGS